MNGPGTGIEKILRRFRKESLGMIFIVLPDLQRPKDLDWSCWGADSYPATLKALAAHKHFDSKKMADAYICGYWRGLRDSAYELTRERPKRRKPSKRRKIR
jgi:hypothetical protein